MKLPLYTSFWTLVEQLTYMHKEDTSFTLPLDYQEVVFLSLLYSSQQKNYIITINHPTLPKLKFLLAKFLPSTWYLSFKTKESFLEWLKALLDWVFPILQKEWLKVWVIPDVSFNSLEDLDLLFPDEVHIDNYLSDEKYELNEVLNDHHILISSLVKEPYKSTTVQGTTKIRVNTIRPEEITLFPDLKDKYKDIEVKVENTPNLYFPLVTRVKVTKSFTFKERKYQIVYTSSILISKLGHITKELYYKYKISIWSTAKYYLELSKRLYEVVSNPYLSTNIKSDLTIQEAKLSSWCQKCGSKSNLYDVVLGEVIVKMKLGKKLPAILQPENIIWYKNIYLVKCSQCENILVDDQKWLNEIIRRRKALWPEDWTSSVSQIPLLSDEIWREVLVHYDTVECILEFNLEHWVIAKPNIEEIINKGRVIWWSEENWQQFKSFYLH